MRHRIRSLFTVAALLAALYLLYLALSARANASYIKNNSSGAAFRALPLSFYVPNYWQEGGGFPTIGGGSSQTGSTSKWASCGSVGTGGSTKAIHAVEFLWGSVSKSKGSTVQVSLQDIDTASGAPGRPDGSVDQSVTIANADTGFASNTWYTTAALDADRTIANGDVVCVVWAFGTFGSGDSFQLNYLTFPTNYWFPNSVTFNGTSWSNWGNANGNVAFDFADGSRGVFTGGLPTASTTQFSINTGTTPDEVALRFIPDVDEKIAGAQWYVTSDNNANFDVVLYDSGSSVLASASVNGHTSYQNSTTQAIQVGWNEVSLSSGQTYRLAIKPTTANNVGMQYFTVGNSSVLNAWPGGPNAYYSQRTDAGAWTDTNTRVPRGVLLVSSIK